MVSPRLPWVWDAAEDAVLEPVGVAVEVDDVGVVDKPVDHRGGHDVVAEHLAPPAEGLVARAARCAGRWPQDCPPRRTGAGSAVRRAALGPMACGPSGCPASRCTGSSA